MNERLTISLLGHKDHGKSTLIGRLLHDTGSVQQERLQEARALSERFGPRFEYAFLLDSFSEERKEGMTIDVIHARIRSARGHYTLIDVPGHEELIKNMLTGASQADAGILIVSAKEGIEEQTQQHLRLARWLGLDRLVVAVNKMDLLSYDRLSFDAIRRQVRSDLDRYAFDADVPIIPLSAYHGENVVHPSDRMNWYQGETLFGCLEALWVADASVEQPMCFPIQDVYTLEGRSIIVGRVESGRIHVGQEVVLLPSGDWAKVKAILHANAEKESAAAGESVGVELVGTLPSFVRGAVLADPERPPRAVRDLVAYAVFIEDPPEQATVECGLASAECSVEILEAAKVGEVSKVLLRLNRQVVVEKGRTSLGRMAIKRNGMTVGVALPI